MTSTNSYLNTVLLGPTSPLLSPSAVVFATEEVRYFRVPHSHSHSASASSSSPPLDTYINLAGSPPPTSRSHFSSLQRHPYSPPASPAHCPTRRPGQLSDIINESRVSSNQVHLDADIASWFESKNMPVVPGDFRTSHRPRAPPPPSLQIWDPRATHESKIPSGLVKNAPSSPPFSPLDLSDEPARKRRRRNGEVPRDQARQIGRAHV